MVDAHLQVGRVDREERVRALDGTLTERLDLLVQALARLAGHALGHVPAAQLLDHAGDLACGRTHDDHLRHRRHQRDLAARIIVEQPGLERLRTVARHVQAEHAEPGGQAPPAYAVAAVGTLPGTLVRRGVQLRRRLGAQHPVERALEDPAEHVRPCRAAPVPVAFGRAGVQQREDLVLVQGNIDTTHRPLLCIV